MLNTIHVRRSGLAMLGSRFAIAGAALLLAGFAAQQAPHAHAQDRPGRSGKPDLVPTVTATAQPGERQFTVQNLGYAGAAEFDVQVQDGAGHVLWRGHSLGLLGQPERQSTSWIVHTGAFPCGKLSFVVDPDNAVSEHDDNSNVVAFDFCPRPDLAVQAVDQTDAGSDQVRFTIANLGEGDAGAFAVQVTGDAGFSQLLQLNSLAAGAKQSFALPGRQAGETIRVVADPGNTQLDYNQLNNLGVSLPAAG